MIHSIQFSPFKAAAERIAALAKEDEAVARLCTGPGRAQYMLVEAARTILRKRSPANSALYEWAAGIAARRGPRVAVVALARKLAGILYAMWRNGTGLEGNACRAAAAA